MTEPRRGMHRIRWAKHEGAEPEMQCERCYEFLPLTPELWDPVHGIRTCRACREEAQSKRRAAAIAKRRADPVLHAEELEGRRAKYRATRRDYSADRYRRNYSTLARFQREASVLGIAHPFGYNSGDGSGVAISNTMLPTPFRSLTLRSGVAASRGQD